MIKSADHEAALTRIEETPAAALGLVAGAALLFLAGFAAPQYLHEAAHDTRHAFTFPCH